MKTRLPDSGPAGFSLVEILVAMTLGVVLLGGALTIYTSSKDGYRLQENIAGLQENGRFAIQALRRNMEMAGFPLILEIPPFVIGGANGTADGGGNASDQITIQYRSDTDCLGAGTPTNAAAPRVAVNRYHIDNGALRCEGNGNPGAPESLVDNVINMQALYGIDDDSDGTANRYVRADQVGTGGVPGWNSVVSLRLALLVSSDSNINTTQQAGGFELLDAPAINPGDNRLYRVFTTTIPLRNRIP